MKSVEVRQELVDALHLDLIGPSDGLGTLDEMLPQAPSHRHTDFQSVAHAFWLLGKGLSSSIIKIYDVESR